MHQTVGTIISGTINVCVAWWMLGSIKNICNPDLLPPDSEWTCPSDRVFFDASVIWGLVGPWRIFGPKGNYPQLNLFFIFGLIGPGIIWLLHKAFPNQKWLLSIHLPVLLGATANMPPAGTVNFNSWLVVAIIFNYFIYKYYRKWWSKYTYVLSGALDAGMAFMLVLLYFTLNTEGTSLDWWGQSEHCAFAKCPTAKGISVPGCPVF
ncbi:putative oligopeptide transporter, OPT superfamily [Lupinus albus]|uniref:Putative oligopeptide transporter, OPT superfamily n=1 Tax=Lupinus albus TaxID=3870 RepID=A0A6A4PRC8_LUPAL|nr:putative oligopeptide transporter, OPT superfamily [Lupinus albus]